MHHCFSKAEASSPLDTGSKLNVHKTFRRRSGRLMYVQFTPSVYEIIEANFYIFTKTSTTDCTFFGNELKPTNLQNMHFFSSTRNINNPILQEFWKRNFVNVATVQFLSATVQRFFSSNR